VFLVYLVADFILQWQAKSTKIWVLEWHF
jgi:hypothetical protein